jgi:hypothetical protein
MQGDGTGDLVLMVSQPKTTTYFGIKPFTKPVITVISLSDQPGRHMLEDLYNQNGYRFVENTFWKHAFGETLSSADLNLDGYSDLIFTDHYTESVNGAAGLVWVAWGGAQWSNLSAKEYQLQNLPNEATITTITNNLPTSELGTTLLIGDFDGGGKLDLGIDFGLPIGDGVYDAHLALISGESLMSSGVNKKSLSISCGQDSGIANVACLKFGNDYYIESRITSGSMLRVNDPRDRLVVPLRKRSDNSLQLHTLEPNWQMGQVGYLDWQSQSTCLSNEVFLSGNRLISGYDVDADGSDDLLLNGRYSENYLLLTSDNPL